MRALLKPPVGKPHVDEVVVDMLARTGRDRIKVQSLNRGAYVIAVDRFRLFAECDRARRISDSEFNTLPWQGAGDDPATRQPSFALTSRAT